MSGPTWKQVARSSDLRGPGPHAASTDGVDVVLVRTTSGDLRAFEGRCPHRGALLGEGELDGNTVVCRNHRWRFDAESGRREGGPECLERCDVREENGRVLVDVSRLVAAKAVWTTRHELPKVAQAAARAGKRDYEDLPGPPPLPLLGNAHQVDAGRLHLQLEEWARRYGSPFRFAIGGRKIMVLSEMSEMMPVLRERPETFRRGSNLEPIFRELGVAGVFSAEGASWRPQRRLSMEALSHRHLRSFYPTLANVASRLRARWMRAAERGDVLDIAEELKRFTVDVTTQLVFGYDIDTIGKDDNVIQEKLGLLFPAINRRLFAVAPLWRIFKLPSDRAVDRALAEVRQWIATLVADARTRLASDPALAENPRNFLEAMLVARDEKGEPFDDETIFGNALTMLLAGEDTTAYTLAWSVHHLLESPSSVETLHRELASVVGEDDVPRDIETTNRLLYAGAVANEAMRVRPVAPLLFHESVVDTVVADVNVPKGIVLAKLIRVPAMSPDNFAAPEVFRPERWLDGPREGAHEPSAHQPFGSGPRICPGRTLALLEMRLVLATLYQSFDVERVGQAAGVGERFAFTMMPLGLEVRLRARQRAKLAASA